MGDEGERIPLEDRNFSEITRLVRYVKQIKLGKYKNFSAVARDSGVPKKFGDTKSFLDEMSKSLNCGSVYEYDANGFLQVPQHLHDYIEFLEKTVSTIGRHQSKERPRICFGVGHSVSMSLAPPILASVRELDPELEINLKVDDTDQLAIELPQGHLECVLGVLPAGGVVQLRPSETDLDLPIAPALVSRFSHPLARRFRSTGFRFVTQELFSSDDAEWGVHVFDGAALNEPRKILTDLVDAKFKFMSQPNYATINELVANGNDLGITLPQFLTDSQLLNMQIMPLDIPPSTMPRLQLLSCRTACSSHYNQVNFASGLKFGEAFEIFWSTAKNIVMEHIDNFNRFAQSKHDPGSKRDMKHRFFVRVPIRRDLLKTDAVEVVDRWVEGFLVVHAKSKKNFSGEIQLSKTLPEAENEPSVAYRRILSASGSFQFVRKNSMKESRELITLSAIDNLSETFVIGDEVQAETAVGETFTASYVRSRQNGIKFYCGKWLGWNFEEGIPIVRDIVVVNGDFSFNDPIIAQTLNDLFQHGKPYVTAGALARAATSSTQSMDRADADYSQFPLLASTPNSIERDNVIPTRKLDSQKSRKKRSENRSELRSE